MANHGDTEGTEEVALLQERLIAAVQQALGGRATPGASVALLLDGEPLLIEAVGFRDVARTAPLETSARFYIYSITKSLIAAAILRLVEQGRLALDAPVQAYLPDTLLDTPVTLRQLLRHSGGIPDYGGMPAYTEALRADPANPWTADEFLQKTLHQGLRFAPGEGWAYSNPGFLLLRQVIETVQGTTLRNALRDLIFAPLGISQPIVAETLEDAEALTPGYSSFFATDGALHDVRALYHPGWVSHGVVIATAAELAQVLDAIFSGTLLGASSRAAMLEPDSGALQPPLFPRTELRPGGHARPSVAAHGMMVGPRRGRAGLLGGGSPSPNVQGRRLTSVALVNSDQDEFALPLAFTLLMMAAGSE